MQRYFESKETMENNGEVKFSEMPEEELSVKRKRDTSEDEVLGRTMQICTSCGKNIIRIVICGHCGSSVCLNCLESCFGCGFTICRHQSCMVLHFECDCARIHTYCDVCYTNRNIVICTNSESDESDTDERY